MLDILIKKVNKHITWAGRTYCAATLISMI